MSTDKERLQKAIEDTHRLNPSASSHSQTHQRRKAVSQYTAHYAQKVALASDASPASKSFATSVRITEALTPNTRTEQINRLGLEYVGIKSPTDRAQQEPVLPPIYARSRPTSRPTLPPPPPPRMAHFFGQPPPLFGSYPIGMPYMYGQSRQSQRQSIDFPAHHPQRNPWPQSPSRSRPSPRRNRAHAHNAPSVTAKGPPAHKRRNSPVLSPSRRHWQHSPPRPRSISVAVEAAELHSPSHDASDSKQQNVSPLYPDPTDNPVAVKAPHFQYEYVRVFASVEAAEEFIGASFIQSHQLNHAPSRKVYTCKDCKNKYTKLLVDLSSDNDIGGGNSGYAVYHDDESKAPCSSHSKRCWSLGNAGSKLGKKGLPPTVRKFVKSMCEEALMVPGTTVNSIKPSSVRDKATSLLEKSPYLKTNAQKMVMREKISQFVTEWRKGKKKEMAKLSPSKPRINTVELLQQYVREHSLVPKEGHDIPMQLPKDLVDVDRMADVVFGLRDEVSESLGREQMRAGNVLVTFPLPEEEWVDSGYISKSCWEYLERVDPTGEDRKHVAVFGSLAMMQNAVEAFRDLKSVVLGSIDTTFNICSNGWKLGALGAYSSSADGKSNSFVPYVFFLCREEDTVTAVSAAAAFSGWVKQLYGFDVDFLAGNVSDRADAFGHLWSEVFPNSPRGQCWTHFKMKFWKSKTTFRRKPIKNYVCHIVGTNKEHYLVNVAGPDVDKLRLGKSIPMMKKTWSLISEYRAHACCLLLFDSNFQTVSHLPPNQPPSPKCNPQLSREEMGVRRSNQAGSARRQPVHGV